MGWIMEGVREASNRLPGGMPAADDEEAERQKRMRKKLKAELATASYGWTAAPLENAGKPFVVE